MAARPVKASKKCQVTTLCQESAARAQAAVPEVHGVLCRASGRVQEMGRTRCAVLVLELVRREQKARFRGFCQCVCQVVLMELDQRQAIALCQDRGLCMGQKEHQAQ